MSAPRRTIAYSPAQRFVRKLQLSSRTEWRNWVRNNSAALRAARIPAQPDKRYKNSGWNGWATWLGAKHKPKAFVAFREWVALAQARDLTTKQRYQTWCAANPDERIRLKMPSSPAYTYREFGGWRDAFAKPAMTFGRVRSSFAPFKEVRQQVRRLKLEKVFGWRDFAKNNPGWLAEHRCPAAPDLVADYANEWRGWGDFLGTVKTAARTYRQ